jgi:rhomboid protease GluP
MLIKMASEKERLQENAGSSEHIPDNSRSTSKHEPVIGVLPGDFQVPGGLVPVAVFRKKSVADEFGLAILAMGESYWAFFSEGRHILCTSPDAAAKVSFEIVAFSKLRRKRRHLEADEPEYPLRWSSAIIYSMILAGFFTLQQQSPIWTEIGRADAVAIIRQSEWWRCITALFLHADSAHLVANILTGAGFGLLLAKLYGGPLAWAMILLCGAMATALTAGIYFPEDHFSIGASTAVFAALGLITATGIVMSLRAGTSGLGLPNWLIPLLGGLALLAFMGVGGGDDSMRRIDLVAHLGGFGVGLLIGLPIALMRRHFFQYERFSRWCGLLFVFWIILLAWVTAMGWI